MCATSIVINCTVPRIPEWMLFVSLAIPRHGAPSCEPVQGHDHTAYGRNAHTVRCIHEATNESHFHHIHRAEAFAKVDKLKRTIVFSARFRFACKEQKHSLKQNETKCAAMESQTCPLPLD